MLTGDIARSDKRQMLIDRFNKNETNDLFCMLLTTKVGGVGLNIVGADRGAVQNTFLFLCKFDFDTFLYYRENSNYF